jgi:hypothetical protein
VKRKTKKRWHNLVYHHAKLTLWPHKGNHFRPHLTRRYGLLAVLVAALTVQGLYNVGSGGSVLGVATTITSEQLLTVTNAQREKAGLKGLVGNEKLARAAAMKAGDMFEKQYWAHESPNGAAPWYWIDQVGYSYDYAGENLAKNFRTAESAMTAWMASPDHRANVLGVHYSEVGFAVVDGVLDGEQTTLLVALYGHEPKDQTAPVVATTASPSMNEPLAPITRLGMAVQSLSPAAVGSVLLLLVAAFVAFVAHVYRRKLPKKLQKSWYRHHGLVKAGGLLSLCIVLLVLYSGGQI